MKNYMFNRYLDLRFKNLINHQKNPGQAQQKAFRKLQKRMAQTAAGRKSRISEFESYKEFVKSLLPQTYDHVKAEVENQISNPSQKSLSKEKVEFIGLSSGTTAEKKQIPYTKGLIDSFNSFQLDVASILYRDFGIEPLKSKRLSWGTTPILDQHQSGIQRGYISGFLSINAPSITRKLSYPSITTSKIPDMKEKAEAALNEVQNENIEFLTGVPTYILGLVEDFQKAQPEIDFQKIWPNCKALAYSAMSIEPFKHRLREIFGKDFRFLGTYITTEGPFGYQIPSLSEKNYFLNYSEVLFGFLDLKTFEIKTVEELCENDEVELLTSTPNGILQYSVGDTLKVKKISPFVEFEVCGRKGQAINLATEKTTQSQLNDAFSILQKKYGVDADHFFVSPGQTSGRPFYQWNLTSRNFSELQKIPAEKLSHYVDLALAEVSEQYEENRFALSLLETPRVTIMPHEPLQKFFSERFSQGQLKIKSVFECPESLNTYLAPIYGNF